MRRWDWGRCQVGLSPSEKVLGALGKMKIPRHSVTPWDCHICRSVGVVLGVNVGIYGSPMECLGALCLLALGPKPCRPGKRDRSKISRFPVIHHPSIPNSLSVLMLRYSLDLLRRWLPALLNQCFTKTSLFLPRFCWTLWVPRCDRLYRRSSRPTTSPVE